MNKEEWKEQYLLYILKNDINVYNRLNKFMPQYIYKYVSLSNKKDDELDKEKIDTLKNNKIYLSSPIRFNDPYDCQLNMDISKELKKVACKVIEIELKKNIHSREDRRQVEKNKNSIYKELGLDNEIKKLVLELSKDWDKLKSEIAVSCLSQENDSMLMWSHYTNAYGGFCIQYKFKDVVECLRKQKLNIYPVIYSNKLQSIEQQLSKYKMLIAAIKSTVSKAEVWNYENEWRIIGSLNNKNENGIKINMPKPTRIYVGCNISKENRNELMNSFDKQVKIVDVKLNPTKYELIVK